MTVTRYNDKQKIRDLYDRTSPYYQSLWGEHIHHGYWISGKETKEKAQIQLIEHLADVAGLGLGGKILDVGCGLEMARKAAASDGVNAKFILMDAEEMKFEQTFDVVWSIESISHYSQKEKFFALAARCLEPGGTLAITDWFRKEHLTKREYEKFILPIEKGMLVELDTMEDYAALLRSNGMQIVQDEILNKNCSKSWDLGLEILKNKALWQIATEYGSEVVNFLRAFRAMRAGFASGNFIYGLIIAKRI